MLFAVVVAVHHVVVEIDSRFGDGLRHGSVHALLLPVLVIVAVAALAEHVRSMLILFDHGHHLRLNVALGLLHGVLWLLWWYLARRRRAHAWRGPALNTLLAASAVFELFDAPPFRAALDGHALWHAATVPLAHLWWRSFVAVELRWRRGPTGKA